MALLNSATRARFLAELGFRGSPRTQIRNFQRGCNLGTRLIVDGAYGPNTDTKLRLAYRRLKAGKPTASAHFSFAEFACQCRGRYAACQGVWIHRTQIRRLEAYRKKVGHALRVVSGCRCYGHNREVGGASSSQHLFGTATDIEGLVTPGTMRAWHLFAGFGYSVSANRVLHADSRDVGGHNATGGHPSAPTTWQYA